MDGQHRDRVSVRIEIGGRRIVARLDQRLEMAGDERRPIVGEQGRLGPHDVEEPGDVAERLFGGDGVARRKPREGPGIAQERVEDFAGGPQVGHAR